MRFMGVRSDMVDAIWGQVDILLQGALDQSRGEMELEDVKTFLKDRTMQLWIGYEEKVVMMVAVTEIIEYPQFKAGRVVLGNTASLDDEWLELLGVMEKWAIEQGCDRMESMVRKGLSKPMKSAGYKEKYIVTDKELSHEEAKVSAE